MNDECAIKVKDVSKSFIIKVKKTLDKKNHKKQHVKKIKNKVLDNISFEIRKGEVVGILGRNGSGKSTLLSILSKIMEPDSGTVITTGKVASILELGMGFHPDMSGRDNVYLKGELYGFSKKELDLKIEKIIQYSGIGQYIDNPVRTYSSGMSGRLAFSIMVHVDSEIMLIDEVLSVGDASFSNKAKQHFKKMANGGKTVVVVSHNISAILEMCTRVLWIENGKIKMDGTARKVCDEYQRMMNESPEIIIDLASEGVPDSQYRLALMYRDGIVFDKNESLYEEWIERSAMQGHIKAQVGYADILLSRGRRDEAKDYYINAAERGDTEARMKLSFLNIEHDSRIIELYELYEKITTTANPSVEYRYAHLLLKTAWSDGDRKKAFDMFLRSANHGFAKSMFQVSIMYRDGLGVERDIGQMESYLIQSANCCFIPAIKMLSDCYTDGTLITKNDKKALYWTQIASELGETHYMYRLASFYNNGVGTEKDHKKANEWFRKYQQASLYLEKLTAADNILENGIDSNLFLEELYGVILLGNDIKRMDSFLRYQKINGKTNDRIIERVVQLANYNDLEAIRYLGRIYSEGIYVDKNYEKALYYINKGIQFEDPWCRRSLGEMYRDGVFVEKNEQYAIDQFMKAAEHGRLECYALVIDMIKSKLEENKNLYAEIISSLELHAHAGNINAIKQLLYAYSLWKDYDGHYDKIDYWKNKSSQLGYNFGIK